MRYGSDGVAIAFVILLLLALYLTVGILLPYLCQTNLWALFLGLLLVGLLPTGAAGARRRDARIEELLDQLDDLDRR